VHRDDARTASERSRRGGGLVHEPDKHAIIYYRKSLMETSELQAAQDNFTCVSLLTDIPHSSLVIPRYSLFPFPIDQEKEINNIGGKLINTYEQHLYVADLGNYVMDLEDYTPATWDSLVYLPENMSFVLKGETNSRKSNWNRDMFAPNKKAAIEVHSRLCDDGLIGQQKIYIRQYIPLKSFMTGINGIPISNEYRFFVAFGKILCGAFYWQNYVEDLPAQPNINDVPKDFLQKIIDIVKNKINFFVIDVAETQNGNWIVIELNDGSQSGLSCNDPKMLYSNLKKEIYNG
jgi:hypothetical protein